MVGGQFVVAKGQGGLGEAGGGDVGVGKVRRHWTGVEVILVLTK